MANFAKNQKVNAATVRGASKPGAYVATHPTSKGDWLEIKPDDGGKNFKTRPALVTAR